MTEFYAPSHNLQCEIDYLAGSGSGTSVFCLTLSPQASVTLKPDGTLTECTGVNCLANAGLNTPTLPYGTSVALGPSTCLSLTTGMRCTMTSGIGFVMASSGVTPIGNVTLSHTTSSG
ncbi:MAG TPA: hypothetical protein VGG09_09935 [Acidimicrobiales bacterium]